MDWELADLGDPPPTLGAVMAASELPTDANGQPISTFRAEHGFLSSNQLAQRYADPTSEATIDGVLQILEPTPLGSRRYDRVSLVR